MRVQTGKLLFSVLAIVMLAVSGCSVLGLGGGAEPAATVDPAAVLDPAAYPPAEGEPPAGEIQPTDLLAYTQAAQTIMAQLTQVLPSTPTAAEAQAAAPTFTVVSDVLPATSTPLPSKTPLPSDTPLPTNTRLPSATFTPALPPTATLPPEPIWRLVSTDDFSFGFWPTEKHDDVGFSYTMGGYRIFSKTTDDLVWSTRSDQFAGVRLEVNARRLTGPMDGYYGLICNFANGSNYYFLGVGVDGWYGIGVKSQNKLTWLIEGLDETGVVHTGGAPNIIRADCLYNDLSLWVNGTLLATVQDKTFSAGAIGLGVGTRSNTGTEVLFDDLSVYQPENVP